MLRFVSPIACTYGEPCVTLTLFSVYINQRVLVRRTTTITYNHTIGYLLGFSLLDLVVDPLLEHTSSILIKQGVGFYLHQEGPNLGKTSCPLSPVTIRLDAQFGTPYPRSAGFDTDIGAFIESSSVSSLLGPMASLIINSDAIQELIYKGELNRI